MTVVVPLSVEIAGQVRSSIVVVLQNKMDLTVGPDGATNLRRHFVEPIGFRYGVNRVKAQSIEAVFKEPVECIFV